MISVVLAGIILGIATSGVLTLATGSQSLINYSEMNTQSRHALENLGRNLRSADSVLVATENELRITRVTSSGAPEEVQYLRDTTNDILTFNNLTTGESTVLLRDINTFTFNYYTLRHNPTTIPLEVKHVQMESELRRRVINQFNRNYIISAQFMLRNRTVSN